MQTSKEVAVLRPGEQSTVLPVYVPQQQQLPSIDKEALNNLTQEILSRIDARHQELRSSQEALFDKFDKLREELLGAVPASGEKHPQQEQQRTPSKSKSLTRSSTTPAPESKKAPKYVPSPTMNNGVEPHEKMSEHTQKEKEKEEKNLFAGHPELFAFLQAKNWDSDFAQDPDKVKLMNEGEKKKSKSCWKRFRKVVKSTKFDIVIGMMILANSIVMGLSLEYAGMRSAQSIGLIPDEGNWPNAEEAFSTMEHFFCLFFLVELLLRIAVERCKYFKQALNWMDCVIVVVSVAELYVLDVVGADFPNMTFIRLLRIFKLVRALRIVRVLKFFESLRVLVSAVRESMRCFIWSVLLLGIVMLIASIFMTQSLQTYLQDESQDPVKRETVYLYFGSWSRSCITLVEMTLAIGTWGKCGRVVIFDVDRYYAIFFVGYLGIVSFAMIRVIAALFLKDTLASAAKDSEVVMAEVNRDPQYIMNVRNVFNDIDNDGDGVLSLEELDAVLHDERIYRWLKALGVVPRELKGLFALMDDGDDKISFGEFLAAIMRIKNAGKGVDLATLVFENKKILARILAVGSSVDELKEDLGKQRKLISNLENARSRPPTVEPLQPLQPLQPLKKSPESPTKAPASPNKSGGTPEKDKSSDLPGQPPLLD